MDRANQMYLPPSKDWLVFLSYRVKTEEEYCERMYLRLENCAGLRSKVFKDTEVLESKKGQNWKQVFVEGLRSSKVFMPLISNRCLSGIQKLTETSPTDNVLLEYELAVELAEKGELQILPILIGEVQDNKSYIEFFDIFEGPQSFPTFCTRPDAIAGTKGAVVQNTIKAIFKNQGVVMNSPKKLKSDVKNEVMESLLVMLPELNDAQDKKKGGFSSFVPNFVGGGNKGGGGGAHAGRAQQRTPQMGRHGGHGGYNGHHGGGGGTIGRRQHWEQPQRAEEVFQQMATKQTRYISSQEREAEISKTRNKQEWEMGSRNRLEQERAEELFELENLRRAAAEESAAREAARIQRLREVDNRQNFMRGRLSREETNELLMAYSVLDGNFFVRESDRRAGQFILCFRYGNEVKNFRIFNEQGSYYITKSYPFETLTHLVDYCKQAKGYLVPNTQFVLTEPLADESDELYGDADTLPDFSTRCLICSIDFPSEEDRIAHDVEKHNLGTLKPQNKFGRSESSTTVSSMESPKKHSILDKLTPVQILDYRQVFDLFRDLNDQGIPVAKVEVILASLGLTPSKAELDQMVKKYDKNTNGFIDFEELLKMLLDCQAKASATTPKCKDCSTSFDSYIKLMQHRGGSECTATKNSKSCKHCNKSFSSFSELMAHVAVCGSKSNPHQGKKFKVLFNRKSNEEAELDITAGEILINIEPLWENWVEATREKDNKRGQVPFAFIEDASNSAPAASAPAEVGDKDEAKTSECTICKRHFQDSRALLQHTEVKHSSDLNKQEMQAVTTAIQSTSDGMRGCKECDGDAGPSKNEHWKFCSQHPSKIASAVAIAATSGSSTTDSVASTLRGAQGCPECDGDSGANKDEHWKFCSRHPDKLSDEVERKKRQATKADRAPCGEYVCCSCGMTNQCCMECSECCSSCCGDDYEECCQACVRPFGSDNGCFHSENPWCGCDQDEPCYKCRGKGIFWVFALILLWIIAIALVVALYAALIVLAIPYACCCDDDDDCDCDDCCDC